MKKGLYLLFILLLSILNLKAQQNMIIDHKCIDLNQIPDEYIDTAKSELNIYFGHKSHGSHLTAGGMSAIMNYSPENATKYAYNSTGDNGALQIYEGDLYYPPVDGWEQVARDYLASHPECNVMIWGPSNSFVSGELNDGSVGYANAQAFIDTVEVFISEYGSGGSLNRPNPVTFVYMTPPVLARYPDNWAQQFDKYSIGTFRADSLIRRHCIENNRWLFDYYDLSTHNPDGENFGGRNDDDYSYDPTKRADDDCSYSLDDMSHTRANWAIDWVNTNPTTENTLMAADNICTTCQHSDGIDGFDNARLTCIMKGKAAWWLWASIAGWNDNGESPTSLPNPIMDKSSEYEIFPNPSRGIITVDSKSSDPIQIKIINLSGKTVYEEEYNVFPISINLDTYSLTTGLYNLMIVGENKIVNKKIIYEK